MTPIPFYLPFINYALRMELKCAGIDLGTSNTCAAMMKLGRAATIELDNEKQLLASVFSHDKRNGMEVVGGVAKTRTINNSFFTVLNSKRVIGVPSSSPRVVNNPYLCGAEMKEGPDGGVVFYREGFDFTITPTEVAAKILSHAKRQLEKKLDGSIDYVTITYPVGFSPRQLEETKKAIRLAGFKEGTYTLIDESSASAIAYIAEEHQYDGTLVMFDIGGGTFDVTIVRVKDGHITILNHIGDESFGGLAIDKRIAEFVDGECFAIHGFHILDPKRANALRTYDRLLRKCEEAKRQLTVAPSADIDLEFPSSVCKAKNLEDPNFSLTLMQSRVRELIQKDIDSCVAMTEKAILECGLTKDDITAVVLIGGTCRLPYVKTTLEAFFQRSIVMENINPDTAVCIGACHYAKGWAQNKEKPFFTMDGRQLFIDPILKENIMMDLGGEALHVVIPRGVPMEKKCFHVCLDTPNTTVSTMKTVLYAGNTKKRDGCTRLREIRWSGFPAKRSYVVHFVLFITLVAERCISVRVEDRVNKTVYFPETEIQYSRVCCKQSRNPDIHHSRT